MLSNITIKSKWWISNFISYEIDYSVDKRHNCTWDIKYLDISYVIEFYSKKLHIGH